MYGHACTRVLQNTHEDCDNLLVAHGMIALLGELLDNVSLLACTAQKGKNFTTKLTNALTCPYLFKNSALEQDFAHVLVLSTGAGMHERDGQGCLRLLTTSVPFTTSRMNLTLFASTDNWRLSSATMWALRLA
jgi:hypothetical protein